MTPRYAERPWDGLPPSVAAALRPELPRLADEIIAAISESVPEYARDLEGPFGQALRVGVAEALRQFVEMVEHPGTGRGPGRDVYVALGRGEVRAGRGLDALLAAYRLGARVAWRRLADAGEAAGLEPRTLYLLAESIFAYIDEISGESIEGYASEQAAAAGERQRRRRRLAALLIQEPPADPAAVEAEAAAAGWTLPRELAAVFAAEGEADRLALRLGEGAIATPAPPGVCALVPDPDAPGRRQELLAAAGERPMALGPTVPWPEAATSAARARLAARLAVEGLIGEAGGLIAADDYSLTLLTHADPGLAADLADRALKPLEGETPASRARLSATLHAWLREQGRTEAVARELHVHPQTVRYRLGRLRELFGDVLERPDGRFELEVALRAGARQVGGPEPGR
ncbi:MAG TPA: helix-turn-helix domain-containing protein [Thermoleophilaceae bacterium]|nr:helix-turn-helix domain-containing protein [Thermoleophilaceae bacterium]